MLRMIRLATAVLTLVAVVVFTGPTPVHAKAATPYQILVRPAVAMNPLDTSHQFTIELRTDSNADGILDDAAVGEQIDLQWVGPPGSAIIGINGASVTPDPSGAASCVTLSLPTEPNGGICSIVVQTPIDVGTGTLTASFAVPDATPGAPDLPALPADQGTTCSGDYVGRNIIESCTEWLDVQRVRVRANHTWVGYAVDVDADGVLPVGAPHTFDLVATRTDGDAESPADAITFNFVWLNGPTGSAVTDIDGVSAPNGNSCTTSPAGTCSVTVLSSQAGSGSLRAESLVGALLEGQPRTEAPTPSSDRLATATWVDWRVVLTPPTATNLVGDPHVFTLTLERNDGTGWTSEGPDNSISTGWTGPAGSEITAVSAGSVDGPTNATCVTDAAGQCTVTVNSTALGDGVLTASEISVLLSGYTPPNTDPDGRFTFDVDDAEGAKTWISYVASVTPSATNLVGDPHTFTITATYDDGAGLTGVPDGSTVGFSWSGDGTPDPPATCTTTSSTCDVVVASDVAGTGTLTATTVTALVDGTQFTDAVVGAASGESLDATKTWVELFADVAPSATNLVGDPHSFTIDGTYDDGTSVRPVPDGSRVFYEWTGPGAASPPSSCTLTQGSCRVTVDSSATGLGTITVVAMTTSIGGSAFSQRTPTAAPEGSLVATKTWVDYRIEINPPTDENLVGNDHLFTVLVERDAGDGFSPLAGAVPAIAMAGVGSIAAETCSAGTSAAGTCTITGVSEDPGDMAVTATLTATEGVRTLTIDDVADKVWVDYRLALTPKQAINDLNAPHVFVAELEVDRGEGFERAGNETLAIGATGVGSIVDIDAAGAAAGSCVTDAAGTCRITVNSAVPGTLFLSVTYQARVGDTTATFTADATKGWIGDDLPETGGTPVTLVRLALVVMAAGLGLLLLARRRRRIPTFS